jgi:hypothetical protein
MHHPELYLYIAACCIIVSAAFAWVLCGALSASASGVVARLCVLAAVAYVIWRRDFYLPFLGASAYPCGSLVQKTPDHADTTVRVNVGAPNVNVVYWAAEPSNDVVANPWSAYNQNANTGVTRADSQGFAMLSVRHPARYKVGGMFGDKALDAHIHYRVCSEAGMLTRVETVKVPPVVAAE